MRCCQAGYAAFRAWQIHPSRPQVSIASRSAMFVGSVVLARSWGGRGESCSQNIDRSALLQQREGTGRGEVFSVVFVALQVRKSAKCGPLRHSIRCAGDGIRDRTLSGRFRLGRRMRSQGSRCEEWTAKCEELMFFFQKSYLISSVPGLVYLLQIHVRTVGRSSPPRSQKQERMKEQKLLQKH